MAGATHLNGKVERSPKTDKIEFYAMQDLENKELDDQLAEWQFHYNWWRPHGALGGKTSMEAACDLLESIPLWDDVHRYTTLRRSVSRTEITSGTYNSDN